MAVTSDERTPLLAEDGRLAKAANGAAAAAVAAAPADSATQYDTAAEVEAASDEIKKSLPRRMVLLSLAAALSGLFIAAIDSTLVVALLGPISSSFNASDRVFWVNTSYLLSMSACSPVFGRLSDVIGRKPCLLGAVTLFGLGTLMCTVAPSMTFLIIARGVQGLGAAGVQPATAVVINDLVPLRSRGMYQASAQLVFSLGYALGGPVGGLLNDRFGWRAAFTLQLPPIVLAFALLSFFLRIPDLPKTAAERARRQHFAGKPLRTVLWSRLDPLGAILFISSIVSMLLAFSLLSAYDLDWSDVRVYSGLLCGFALFAIFLYVEIYVAEEPLMPLRIMRQRSLASIWAVYLLITFTGSMLFYFPFYFIVIMRQTSTEIGLHYLPISVATMASSFVAGALLKRTGRYWKLALGGSLLGIATPAYIATWSNTNRPPAWGQNLCMLPAAASGSGLNTVLMVALLAIAGQQDAASAISLLYTVRSLGVIAGLAVMGSVIQKVLVAELTKSITGPGARKTISLIRKNVNAITSLPEAQQLAAQEAYSKALQTFFLVMTALAVITVAFVMLVEERPLGESGKDAQKTTASPPAPAEESAEEHEA